VPLLVTYVVVGPDIGWTDDCCLALLCCLQQPVDLLVPPGAT